MEQELLGEIEHNYYTSPGFVKPVFAAAANRIMELFNLSPPTSFEESLQLYHTLVTYLHHTLNF